MDTLRLWDYFTSHANDPLVNAGKIAQEFGWPRAAVLHYFTFLLMGGAIDCDRGRELVKALDRIRPEMDVWLRGRGFKTI